MTNIIRRNISRTHVVGAMYGTKKESKIERYYEWNTHERHLTYHAATYTNNTEGRESNNDKIINTH